MPLGYSLWVWLKANPIAQYALAIGAAYIAFRVWLAGKVRRARTEGRIEGERQIIDQIEEQTNDTLQRVEADRAIVRDLTDDELRKSAEASPHNRGRLRRTETN